MFFARRDPDHIAGPDLLDAGAFALNPAKSRGHDQRLAERVGVPCSAGAGFERDRRATDAGAAVACEGRVDPHGSGKPVLRPFD